MLKKKRRVKVKTLKDFNQSGFNHGYTNKSLEKSALDLMSEEERKSYLEGRNDGELARLDMKQTSIRL